MGLAKAIILASKGHLVGSCFAPGHTAGQVVFLWPEHGAVLVAASAAGNIFGLGYAMVYEDLEQGKRSLAELAGLDFDMAYFGHGRASQRFRQK